MTEPSHRDPTSEIVAIGILRLSRMLAALVRNPLDALPPEIHREPIVFTKFGGRLRVHLTDPVLIHQALVVDADAWKKGEEVRISLGPALGDGLLTSDGEHWKRQRRSVAGAFRHEKLLGFLPTMIEAAERTRDRFLAAAPGTVDVGHEMMATTFEIVMETMVSGGGGMNVAKVERGITDYLSPTGWQFAFGILRLPSWTPFPGRSASRRAVTYLRTTLAAMVAERRRLSERPADLVSMLIDASDPETGIGMDDDEIVDNVLTFVTAGHETTALGLAWTLHLLSRHPEHEKRILDEIAEVVGDGPLLPEHVGRLEHARKVFSEAMRLFPPAPILTRTALRDVVVGGRLIPEGSNLYIPIHAVHRRTEVWPDPDVFDPDRFSPESVRARPKLAFMPFGAGPRFCIGSAFAIMEAVAILAVLLPAVAIGRAAGPDPVPVMKITLRPKKGLSMTVSRRRPSTARNGTERTD